MKDIRDIMMMLAIDYQSELDAIRRNPNRPVPVIREKEGMACAFEAVIEMSEQEIKLGAKLELLSLLFNQMDAIEGKL